MPEFFKKLMNRRLAVAFFMGFSAGLPLLITMTLMQAWAKEATISLKDIGLMTLVGIPYTIKFLWAPIFDRYSLPFLGRRRGWLLLTQIAIILSVIAMGLSSPTPSGPGLYYFILTAFLVTFFSASQDILIDSYRREDLLDSELGIGSSYYIYGYRVGMLMVSGVGLILAEHMSWLSVFLIMAAFQSIGVVVTLITPEPKIDQPLPRTLKESVIDPFVDFFKNSGAIWILLFILLYKLGDNMALTLTTPFYMDLGFTKEQIGLVVKGYGFWATMAGALVGGIALLKISISRALWIFGFLQMISIFGMCVLSQIGNNVYALGAVVTLENFTMSMATAAFTAFMASLTNKRFTATQYALLTSLMGVPRVIFSSSSGYFAETLGWFNFYIFCMILAVPGMLLLLKFAPWNEKKEI